MVRSCDREEIEAALAAEEDYSILQETDGLVIYQTHKYPGNDLVLDWSRGKCYWEDIEAQLKDNGIDPQAIYSRLPHLA